MSRHALVLLGVLAAVAMGACRKEEQNRPTSFTPGVYKGDAMPTLTKDIVTDLNKRGQLQK